MATSTISGVLKAFLKSYNQNESAHHNRKIQQWSLEQRQSKGTRDQNDGNEWQKFVRRPYHGEDEEQTESES